MRFFLRRERVEPLYIISKNQLFTIFYLKNDTELDSYFYLLKHTKLYDINILKTGKLSKEFC